MSSISVPSVVVDRSSSRQSSAKKRKIRKGTFSCWECKKRKTRCELEPGSNSPCAFCRSRGLACVSQEFTNPADGPWNNGKVHAFVDGRDGIESQVFRKRRLPEDDGYTNEHGIQEVGTRFDTRGLQLSLLDAVEEPLSIRLFSTLPEPSIATLIMSRGTYVKLPIHVRKQSLQKVSSSILGIQHISQVADLPSRNDPPVHFARKFIQLALCLQQLDEATAQRVEGQLKERVSDVAKRYINLASRHVTSQDSLVDSLDGVETILLEACYHINVGDMRAAWLLFRRALALSQLLGLPKAGPRTESLWFRLVYGDRFLSLMLGLPCIINDNIVMKKSTTTDDCPTEQLERLHVGILARIVSRNVHMHRRRQRESEDEPSYHDYDDYKETQDIDYELKQAIRCVPVQWWDISALRTEASDMETMGKTARIMAQLHHHFYLAVLHQPYTIEILHHWPSLSESATPYRSSDLVYSQTAALAASRGLLSCYMTLRGFYRSLSYRPIDDKAFIAATIILLTHIDGHRLGRGNVLEHQRPRDLALAGEVIKMIGDTARRNQDKVSHRNTQTLQRLVEIEGNEANGVVCSMWMEEASVSDGKRQGSETEQCLSLPIAYFGVLCFSYQRQSTSRELRTTSYSEDITNSTLLASTLPEDDFATKQNIDRVTTTAQLAPDSQPQAISHYLAPVNADNDRNWASSIDPCAFDIAFIPQELPPPVQPIHEQEWLYEDVDFTLLDDLIAGDSLANDDGINMGHDISIQENH